MPCHLPPSPAPPRRKVHMPYDTIESPSMLSVEYSATCSLVGMNCSFTRHLMIYFRRHESPCPVWHVHQWRLGSMNNMMTDLLSSIRCTFPSSSTRNALRRIFIHSHYHAMCIDVTYSDCAKDTGTLPCFHNTTTASNMMSTIWDDLHQSIGVCKNSLKLLSFLIHKLCSSRCHKVLHAPLQLLPMITGTSMMMVCYTRMPCLAKCTPHYA